MVNVPTFVEIPGFAGSGSRIQPPEPLYSNGYLPGQTLPAEYENFFLNGFSLNGLTEQASIVSVVTELTNFLTAYGTTPDPGLFNQFLTTMQAQLALKANLASPVFTGTVTIPAVPAPSAGSNPATKTYVDSASSALTAAIASAVAPLAPLASPTFTGVPAAPTPSPGDDTTKLATTAFVKAADDVLQASINSSSLFSGQAFTGNFSNTVTDTISAMSIGELKQVVVHRTQTGGGSDTYTLKLPATGTFTFSALVLSDGISGNGDAVAGTGASGGTNIFSGSVTASAIDIVATVKRTG